MKDIAVIIVNYKMKAPIERCIASLMEDIKTSALSVQVVVVDNASDDGIESYLKSAYPEVRCIPLTENKGFGAAQNIGMSAVPATYYFALNPDTEFIEPRTLQRLYEWMESHPRVGMVGPKIFYPDKTLQYSCWRFPTFWQPLFSRTTLGNKGIGKKRADHFLMKDFSHNETRPVDALMGSAMFVRGRAIQDVGMFDERFWMYFEDIDWSRSMWEAGWPVYYVHDICIQHTHGRGSAKVSGVIQSLLKNKLTRIHVMSWLAYMWKWRHNNVYYE